MFSAVYLRVRSGIWQPPGVFMGLPAMEKVGKFYRKMRIDRIDPGAGR